MENLEYIGKACVYCGTITQDECCGEVHNEDAFETTDGEIILESEL